MMVTLNVGGFGGEHVSYTDPSVPGGVGSETLPNSRTPFSSKIVVPKGSTVAITWSGTADAVLIRCTVTDETDRLVLVEGKENCSYVAN